MTRVVSSLACVPCRKRHIKCPGGDPCANCTRASKVCEYQKSRRGGFRIPRKLQQFESPPQALTPPTSSYEEVAFVVDPQGSHWETVYNGYYDLFHSKHPFLPPRDSGYVNKLFSAPELRASMALLVHILSVDQSDSRFEGSRILRQHIQTVEETIGRSPDQDTVKLQSLILLAIASHLCICPDVSLRARVNACQMLEGGTASAESLISRRMIGIAPELCNTMTLEAVHELFFVDVMIEAAYGRASTNSLDVARFEKLPAESWSYNAPQVSEATKLRYHCVSLVSRLANMTIQPEEAQIQALYWQEVIASHIAKSTTAGADERLVLASLCTDFCLIMATMHNSTLQSCARACDVSQSTQGTNTPEEPSRAPEEEEPNWQRRLNTATIVKAANSLLRAAANSTRDPSSPSIVANSHSPLVTCGLAMCLLIHLKSYNEQRRNSAQASHYLLTTQSAVEFECACLDALGCHWPLAAEIVSRMRLLILHHVPHLYAYAIGTGTGAGSALVSPPTTTTASYENDGEDKEADADKLVEIGDLSSVNMVEFFDQLFDFESIAA